MSTFERLQRLQKGQLSRKQRKQLEREFRAEDPAWEIVHPHAAGIDVGSASHFVAVAPGKDPQPVREFGSWTAALQEMVTWLKGCGIQTVVLQSTGVYWVALYDQLEKAGFDVWLVNARGTKNLPGRKSDVQECQWLRKLHTYGLLRHSFRPPTEIRAVRAIWRLRERHIGDAGRSVQHMQKALITMNVQLAQALSDISGVSGQAIIRAILGGERDPWKLAQLRDKRVQASAAEVAHSLYGNWREETLFELRQAVEAYDFAHQQITECDQQLQRYMATLPTREAAAGVPPTTESVAAAAGKDHPIPVGKPKRKAAKNQPAFNLDSEVQRVLGVDLTRIDGINIMTAQVICAELGPDLSCFPSEGHFASWLTLAPRREISGGKVIRQEPGHAKNRVANALRMAAESLWNSDSYLGARYRHFRARLGGKKAVKAMARYLACLIYRMLTKGQGWVDRGAAHFENNRKERELMRLKQKASALGLQLIPAPSA